MLNIPKEKLGPAIDIIRRVIIVLFAVVSLVSLVASASIMVARKTLSEETMDKIVSTIEVDSEKNTIDEWVYLYFANNYPDYLDDFHITQEGVSYCLDYSNFADFMRQKLKDYTSDVLHNSGTGIMTSDEFMDFIEENREVIETGSRAYGDAELEEIRNYFRNMDMFLDISLESICEKIGFKLTTLQSFLERSTLFLFITLFIVSTFFIMLLARRRIIPLLTVGINSFITGFLFLILYFVLEKILTQVAVRIQMGASLISSIIAPVSNIFIVTAVLALAVGFVCINLVIMVPALRRLSKESSKESEAPVVEQEEDA